MIPGPTRRPEDSDSKPLQSLSPGGLSSLLLVAQPRLAWSLLMRLPPFREGSQTSLEGGFPNLPLREVLYPASRAVGKVLFWALQDSCACVS